MSIRKLLESHIIKFILLLMTWMFMCYVIIPKLNLVLKETIF